MVRYTVKEHRVEDESLGEYVTNGICLHEGDAMIDEIRDVSSNQVLTQQLAELLNKDQVSEMHFRDVVADFIAEA